MRSFNLALLGLKTFAGNEPPPTPDPVPSDMFYTTLSVSNGTANMFVRTPEDLDNPPDGGWPLIVFWGGDGTDNNTTTEVGDQAMSTSDNFTYTYATGSLGTNRRIASTTLKIKVNDVVVGTGRFGGTIEGEGIVEGSFSVTSNSTTVSVEFDSDQTGNTVEVTFVHSTMFYEGAPLYVNLGDTLDERVIFVAIQQISDNVSHTASYLHNVVTYIYNNYDLNTNRIYQSGLSRGGLAISTGARIEEQWRFYIDTSDGVVYSTDDTGRIESGVAAFTWATATISGTYTNVANYKSGIALVHSTGDGTVGYGANTLAQTWGAESLREYPYIWSPEENWHNATLWHTNMYNRKYRTDASGTAFWDWVDFSCRYSLDDLENAELAMQQAEKRRNNDWRDWDDWKYAALKISQLGASSEKTALESRLTSLRTAIGGTIWIIVHGNASVSNSPYYEVNSMTNHADDQTVSNLVDTGGTTHSGTSIGTGDNSRTGTFQAAVSNNSGVNNAGNFPVEYNGAGAVAALSGGGTIPMSLDGFASGTYTLRVYLNARTATTFSMVLNSVTKEVYGQNNSLLGYIEYTGLSETDIEDYTINLVDTTGTNHFMTVTELIKTA